MPADPTPDRTALPPHTSVPDTSTLGDAVEWCERCRLDAMTNAPLIPITIGGWLDAAHAQIEAASRDRDGRYHEHLIAAHLAVRHAGILIDAPAPREAGAPTHDYAVAGYKVGDADVTLCGKSGGVPLVRFHDGRYGDTAVKVPPEYLIEIRVPVGSHVSMASKTTDGSERESAGDIPEYDSRSVTIDRPASLPAAPPTVEPLDGTLGYCAACGAKSDDDCSCPRLPAAPSEKWSGAPNNWIAPMHKCPSCHESLTWEETVDVFDRAIIVGRCKVCRFSAAMPLAAVERDRAARSPEGTRDA